MRERTELDFDTQSIGARDQSRDLAFCVANGLFAIDYDRIIAREPIMSDDQLLLNVNKLSEFLFAYALESLERHAPDMAKLLQKRNRKAPRIVITISSRGKLVEGVYSSKRWQKMANLGMKSWSSRLLWVAGLKEGRRS